MADTATLNNNTRPSRPIPDAANSGFVFLGLENSLNKVLPSSVSPSNLFNFGLDQHSQRHRQHDA